MPTQSILETPMRYWNVLSNMHPKDALLAAHIACRLLCCLQLVSNIPEFIRLLQFKAIADSARRPVPRHWADDTAGHVCMHVPWDICMHTSSTTHYYCPRFLHVALLVTLVVANRWMG